MEENRLNEALKDKVDALGSDMIMGTMKQLSGDTKERIDKLNDAVDEYKEANSEAAAQAAVTGDALEAMRRAGIYRKTRPIARDYKKIGRNDPCPCGAVDENGKPKKYKNCCLDSGKYETTHFE